MSLPLCRGPDEIRGPLIGLSLFMVVAMTLTWLVYVTLRRDVAGRTAPYAAVFTDVSVCARVTTSGWPAFASAGWKRSN